MARDGRLFDPDLGRSRRRGRVRRGWDETVTAMRQTGRVEPVDAVVVALGRVIGDQCDAIEHDPDQSPYVRATMYTRMLAAVAMLYDRTGTDDDGPTLDQLLAGVDDPAHRPPV